MLDTLQTQISAVTSRIDKVYGSYQYLNIQMKEVIAKKEETEKLINALLKTSVFLQQFADMMIKEGSVELTSIVTYGLRSVFSDPDWEVKASTYTQRNLPCVDLTTKHGTVEGDVLETFGGGIAAVESFLFRILAVLRLNLAPVFLVDEGFSHVAAQYIPSLGQLLRKLAEDINAVILVITHDKKLMDCAHKIYETDLSDEVTKISVSNS